MAENLNNNSLINERIQQGKDFIVSNLLDYQYGGYYQKCEANGSNPATLKYASFQAFSALAFYNLFLKLHDFRFRQLADAAINFLINYLWDSSNTGFYHFSDRIGNVGGECCFSDTKVSAYQAWTTLALLKNYELTKNNLILTLVNQTLNFLLEKLWDKNNSIFFKSTAANGSNPEGITLSYYDFWIITALLKAYQGLSDEKYLEYSNLTINYLYKYLWNPLNQSFYYSSYLNGTLFDNSSHLVVQTSALIALTELYAITGNITHLSFIQNISKSIITNFWDPINQGFYDMILPESIEPSKNPSIQSTLIYAFTSIEILNITQTSLQNYSIATLNFLLETMWDSNYSGYFYEYYANGSNSSDEKWIIDQVWVLYALSLFVSESRNLFTKLIILIGVLSLGIIFAGIYILHKKSHKELTEHKSENIIIPSKNEIF